MERQNYLSLLLYRRIHRSNKVMDNGIKLGNNSVSVCPKTTPGEFAETPCGEIHFGRETLIETILEVLPFEPTPRGGFHFCNPPRNSITFETTPTEVSLLKPQIFPGKRKSSWRWFHFLGSP